MAVVQNTSMLSSQNQGSTTEPSDDSLQNSPHYHDQTCQNQHGDNPLLNNNKEDTAWKLASIMRLAGTKADSNGFEY